MLRTLSVIWVCLIFMPWQASLATEQVPPEAIRAEIELLRESGQISADSIQIAAVGLIGKVYERRGFAPGWGAPGKVDSLLEVIRASYRDGLNPADYHLAEIEQLQRSVGTGRQLSTSELASFELMLTDSLIRLTYHQRYGKVDLERRDAAWAFSRPMGDRDSSLVIQEMLDAETVADAILSVAAQDPGYQRLKTALQLHRVLAADGSWPEVPGGPTIRPGSDDPRLATLARRLAISGDLADDQVWVESSAYDTVLQTAVSRFQARHGLEVDALVGRATLRALNVSVEQRINQIRLNLERARWRFNAGAKDFILVNIAGFKAYVVRDGKIVWTTKVIVGDTENKTPVFSAALKYVVINPDWTVPYKIASEELLPDIKQDPDFFTKGNYQLFDVDGGVVDPISVDWSSIRIGNFPFTLVQQPCSTNQLGRIKFIFPNEYSVYMHDTPGKFLFTKAKRAFSHGCIRVDEPLGLAEVVLDGEGWTREQIESQVRSGETRTVNLSEPLPVFVFYWTAEVNDQGLINFYEDIYERDATVLESLDR